VGFRPGGRYQVVLEKNNALWKGEFVERIRLCRQEEKGTGYTITWMNCCRIGDIKGTKFNTGTLRLQSFNQEA
jgi:hypothetical protein